MISYRATLDVPAETLTRFTHWLKAHRHRLGTRKGARTASCRQQAILALRWFRDDSLIRILAHDAGLPISTAYRYLHEGITVLAEQAPDLHDVLDRGRVEGWSHASLDGTLLETDRVREKKTRHRHRRVVLQETRQARRQRPGPE